MPLVVNDVAGEPEETWETDRSSFFDNVQTGLSVAGLIPVIGEAADITNALVSLGRGNYGEALLNAVSAIPLLGYAAVGAKVVRTGAKAVDEAVEAAGNAKRFDPDQQALVELAKEAKQIGSVTEEEAKTLMDWANEYKLPGSHGPEVHPNRPGPASNVPHIHVGPVGHIPID